MLACLFLLAQSRNVTFDGAVNTDRVRHFECFNVVRIIDRATRSDKEATAISDEVSAHCNKLPNPRKEICSAIIAASLANITAQLADTRRPDAICESLGYPRPFAGGREITAERCASVVDLVKAEPAPAEGDQGGKKVPLIKLPKPFGRRGIARIFGFSAACKSVAQEERLVCHVISRFVLRGQGIDKSTSSGAICEKLDAKHLIKIVAGTGAAPPAVEKPAAAPEAPKAP
jgi:hypothetical protein